MAGSVNKVILLGHLGRDPEVKHTQDGRKIVNLQVATSERWKDKNSGEQREKTEWHRVVVFNERLADVAEKYLSKGKPVYLEGQLQTRKWQTQAGEDRYSTEVVLQNFRGEIVLLGGKGEGSGHASEAPGEEAAQQRSGKAYQNRREHEPRQAGGGGQSFDDLDDEIPFSTPFPVINIP